MKKIIITMNLILATLLISGCGCSKKELKTVTCRMNKNFENYYYDAKITIVYNDKTKELISIEESENITSDDSLFLDNIKLYEDGQNSAYNDISNAEYSTTIEDNKLTRKLYINYEKTNMDKLVETDGLQSIFYDENSKTNIDYALDYYIENGNSCS